jgi:hypothetical protein
MEVLSTGTGDFEDSFGHVHLGSEGNATLDRRPLPRKRHTGTKYRTLYERLVANTKQEDPDNPNSCWVWIGHLTPGGYPKLAVRLAPRPAHPVSLIAHRLMLEEVLWVKFPFDEAGHLCFNTRCINPDHLEVQTKWFNSIHKRVGNYRTKDHHVMIPTLFPVEDELQLIADAAWDATMNHAPIYEVEKHCPI